MNDGKVTTNGEEIRDFCYDKGIECPFRVTWVGVGIRLEVEGDNGGVASFFFPNGKEFEYFLQTIRKRYYELEKRFTMKGDDEKSAFGSAENDERRR